MGRTGLKCYKQSHFPSMSLHSPGPRAERWPRRHLTRVAVCLGFAVIATMSLAAAPRQAGERAPAGASRPAPGQTDPAATRACSTATASPVTTSGCAPGTWRSIRWTRPTSARRLALGKTWSASCAPARCRRPGMPRPDAAALSGVVASLTAALDQAGAAEPGTAAAAPPQPGRVRQRRARSARHRRGREVAAAGRRLGVRLRQQRRPARGVAVAARALSRRRRIA